MNALLDTLPNWPYMFAGLGIAALTTLVLRVAGFIAKRGLQDSRLMAIYERWMPMAVVTALATFFVLGVDFSSIRMAAPELVGIAVTIVLHLWRSNFLISIASGAAVCVGLANMPGLG